MADGDLHVTQADAGVEHGRDERMAQHVGVHPGQAETRALPVSHGITVYPFLWSREAHEDLAATTRARAPMAELFSLQDEFADRFAAEPNTTAVHVHVE